MAQITHGDVGDTWVPQATFKVGGTPTDPTNITVKVRDAAGTVTTLGPVSGATGGSGIVRVSAGVFNTVIPITAAGYWYANFTGTGAAAASEDHEYRADPSLFSAAGGIDTRALVGLGETKDWLQTQNIDTGQDLDLVRVINDISDRFHQEAEREFKVSGTNPQTRVFSIGDLPRTQPWYVDGEYMGARNTASRTVKVGDLTSFTAVSILDRDWTTVLESPAVGLVTGHPMVRATWQPITELELHQTVTTLGSGMRLSVTGNWGFPAVPGDVRQAVLDAVAAVMDRDVEHYRQDLGAVAASQEGGTVVMVGRSGGRLLSLPPAAQAVAWRYRASLITVG
jgi:hypothetical protein